MNYFYFRCQNQLFFVFMSELSSKHSMPIGKKIERLRKIKGIKQEALASDLGITRQSMSKLEQSDSIGDDKLGKIAEVLGISADAIKEYNDEVPFNFANYFHDNSINHGALNNYYCNINPIEKWVEAINENKRLYEELLKTEREKIALLESMLKVQESQPKKR